MDLVSGCPFWPIQDGLPASYPALDSDVRADVAVIGAGITGALVAFHLAEAGVDTVVLDRRDVATASTAACTALLQYETDLPLFRLARRVGEDRAVRAYRACQAAVRRIATLASRLGNPAAYADRESLLCASRTAHAGWLEREYAMQARHGFPVEFWDRRRLRRESDLPHPAALLSRGAAQLDPYLFTHALLAGGVARGLRVFDRTTVQRVHHAPRSGWRFRTSSGAEVRARRLVLAAGYESQNYLRQNFGALHSTYALVTEPLPELRGWPGRRLLWDTASPYTYLRTTDDHRVIIGGADEPFRDPRARDALLGHKTALLLRRLHRWLPRLQATPAYAWTGTFAVTRDSLPFIGASPESPDTYLALGYGGNGVLFSALAGEIIRDLHLGRPNPDAELFRFDREPAPARG